MGQDRLAAADVMGFVMTLVPPVANRPRGNGSDIIDLPPPLGIERNELRDHVR